MREVSSSSKEVEIDEDTDGEKKVIVKKIRKNGEEVEVTVNGTEDVHIGDDKLIFISDEAMMRLGS